MENKEYLEHSGVIGMHWGKRNYQYPDGTWTELGKARRRAMSGAGEAARRVKKVLKKTGKVTAATIKRTRKAISDASERSRERKAIRNAKKEEKIQKIVAKAIRKNDIETILKYSSHMDSSQLKDAASRAKNIKSLRDSMPAKKQTFAQKVATDIGKYAVDKGAGLAKKAANNAAKKTGGAASGAVKKLLNSATENAKSENKGTWSYADLRKQQENSGGSKRQSKKKARREAANETLNWLRAVNYEGPVFRDVDGAHSGTKWHTDNLSKVANQYLWEREKKKRYNNYVWHGMRTKRKRRRRR